MFASMLTCCDNKTDIWSTMNEAEKLMNIMPDSSLILLSSINVDILSGDEEKARFALLMSMALDKNYIDTTTFDVLKPAIDFYLEKGDVDSRLRTLYYQGRIYQNKLDYDMAMQAFLKAEMLNNDYNDTLTYANLLVAQGNLYAKSYQMKDFVKNNLLAAGLYERIGDDKRQLSSLIRALDGSIISGDKETSDSIMSVANNLAHNDSKTKETLSFIKMAYGIKFNSDADVKSILDSVTDINIIDDESKLDITLGYLKLNDIKRAKKTFESIDINSPIVTSLRYLLLMYDIYENEGKYKEALEAYKIFQRKLSSENEDIYSQKTSVAQEIHELELNHFYTMQRKDRQLWLGLSLVLVLIICTGIIYYQLRLSKISRMISEKEQSRLLLENENLQRHNSVLELEKNNAQLEREKQSLYAENLRLKILQLESEGERLKNIIAETKLSKPIMDSIQERIGILNGLLAAKISDNEVYSRPFDKWINQVTDDRKCFMDSTRLAFRASHPAFMKYLDEHGLNDTELNYVCLYAIGLRGKEIGEYIQVKRHYHMSTDIRKKLGLNEDDTNLGLHIRNLMKKL